MKKKVAILLTAIFVFSVNLSARANTFIPSSSWINKCPAIKNLSPSYPQPQAFGFTFDGTGQNFSRIDENTNDVTSKSLPIIGCYVEANLVNVASQDWQIGSINRDAIGFYWINAAGISWRLSLTNNEDILETDASNPYYQYGNKFILKKKAFIKSTDEARPCKLTDYTPSKTVRLDFPISQHRISPIGSPKVLLAVEDFADSPYTGSPKDIIEKILAPSNVQKFFEANSFGQMHLNFDIYPSIIRSNYLYADARPVGSSTSYKLPFEAISKMQSSTWNTKYDAIFVLGYGKPEVFGAWASGSETPLKEVPYEFYNPGFGWLGIYNEADNQRLPSWKILAHELGHLMGLIDLGAYQDPTNYWNGRTPGPFDLMGQEQGVANEFLGWNRWLLGWIADNQVSCITNIEDSQYFNLSAMDDSGDGKKMIVLKLSDEEAVIIESRRNGIFDSLGNNEGILVYKIDIKHQHDPVIPPIQILARDSESLRKPYSPAFIDSDRFLEATLNPGQYVDFNGILILDKSKSDSMDVIGVFKNQSRTQQLQDITKAAADKAAADKAAADKAAKKSSTITCIKGKIIKRVTGINPKCPAGYLKK